MWHMLVQVNSYSLNSVGPTVESFGGGERFLAVYAISALTSTYTLPQLLIVTMLLDYMYSILYFACMWNFSLVLTEEMAETAGSGLSYTLCTAPSVGASGAIFGLVSLRVYILVLMFCDLWHLLVVKVDYPLDYFSSRHLHFLF